jgi:hypothetical protein
MGTMKIFAIYAIFASQVARWISPEKETLQRHLNRWVTAIALAMCAMANDGMPFALFSLALCLLFIWADIDRKEGGLCLLHSFAMALQLLAMLPPLIRYFPHLCRGLSILSPLAIVAAFPFCAVEKYSKISSISTIENAWRTSAYMGCIGLRILGPADGATVQFIFAISIAYYALIACCEYRLWKCLGGLQMAYLFHICQNFSPWHHSAAIGGGLLFCHFFFFGTIAAFFSRQSSLTLTELKGTTGQHPWKGYIAGAMMLGLCLHPWLFIGSMRMDNFSLTMACALLSQIIVAAIGLRWIICLSLPSQKEGA